MPVSDQRCESTQPCHLKGNAKTSAAIAKHRLRFNLLARFFASGEFGLEELELCGGVSVGDLGGSMSWAILRNTFGSHRAERLDKLLGRIFWKVSKSMRLQARAPSDALSLSSGDRIAVDDASGTI